MCRSQIYSSNVKTVRASARGTFVDGCDGLIIAGKEIFMADGIGEFKAAIHVGWKGLSVGITENSFEILQKKIYVRQEEIKVYIGPHIRL
jgi:copper oxidase (laccase) domain-containing protein